jgi:hypothetical protein
MKYIVAVLVAAGCYALAAYMADAERDRNDAEDTAAFNADAYRQAVPEIVSKLHHPQAWRFPDHATSITLLRQESEMNIYQVTGWVDAQNSKGVWRREKWTCNLGNNVGVSGYSLRSSTKPVLWHNGGYCGIPSEDLQR